MLPFLAPWQTAHFRAKDQTVKLSRHSAYQIALAAVTYLR